MNCVDANKFVDWICRACSRIVNIEDLVNLHRIFTVDGKPKRSMQFVYDQMKSWDLHIAPDDGLPQQICDTCLTNFDSTENFRNGCMNTHEQLTAYYGAFRNVVAGQQLPDKCAPTAHDDFDAEESAFYTPPIVDTPPASLFDEACDDVLPMQEGVTTIVYEEGPSDSGALMFSCTNIIQGNFRAPRRDSDATSDLSWDANEEDVIDEKEEEEENVETEIDFKRGQQLITVNTETFNAPQLKVQAEEEPSECTICGLIFKSEFLLTQHSLKHKKPVGVPSFPEYSSLRSSLGPNYFSSYTQRNAAVIPNRRYSNAPRMMVPFQREMKGTKSKVFSCSQCDRTFDLSILLVIHIRLHTQDKLRCNLCGQTNMYESSLRLHQAEVCEYRTTKTANIEKPEYEMLADHAETGSESQSLILPNNFKLTDYDRFY